jgi:hypothetical protein
MTKIMINYDGCDAMFINNGIWSYEWQDNLIKMLLLHSVGLIFFAFCFITFQIASPDDRISAVAVTQGINNSR